MAQLKDILGKAKGIFFEDVGNTLQQNPDATGANSALGADLIKELQKASGGMTLADLNKQMPGINTSDINVNVNQASINPSASVPKPPAAPLVNGENVDFSPIYTEAGLAPVPLTAEAFLKMVDDLGADFPMAAKRTMVGTMLNTMAKNTPDVNSANIVNDALTKIKTLSNYSEGIKAQLTTYVAEREKAIAEAKAKIESEQKAADNAKQRVEKMVGFCEKEGNKLDDVLEFFSSDTGQSKLAPAELKV